MSAKSQKERDQKAREKREKVGEAELRHRVRPGIRAMLDDLMQWHGIDEMAEAVQLLIMNAHALGPERSGACLSIPRHDFTISENVARELYAEGARQAQRLDATEQ